MTARPPSPGASARDAVWRHDETVLAIRLALDAGTVDPSDPPPDVVALSASLSAAAKRSGRGLSEWSRCPRAVALKVNALCRGIADERYRPRLGATAAKLLAGYRQVPGAEADADPAPTGAASSRTCGPAPAVGAFVTVRTGADARVYVMVLTGAAQTLAAVAADRSRLFKVGRSDDLPRRLGQLNWGLPRDLGLWWEIFAASGSMDLGDAHVVEQSLLDRIEALDLSAGGEFARCRLRRFKAILAGFGLQTMIRPAACAMRASTDKVMPDVGRNAGSRSALPPSAPVAAASVDSLKCPSSGRPMPASHRP